MDKNLFEIVRNIGICETGKRYLDKEKKDIYLLIKVWKRWPEYLIEHSTQVVDIFRQYLTENDKLKLEESNIYFDSIANNIIDSDTVFISGTSKIDLEIKDWAVVKIYLFDNSNLNLMCGENSIVNIECYNDAHIEIESKENSRIVVFQNDQSTVVSDKAKIVKKTYKRGEVFNGSETVK